MKQVFNVVAIISVLLITGFGIHAIQHTLSNAQFTVSSTSDGTIQPIADSESASTQNSALYGTATNTSIAYIMVPATNPKYSYPQLSNYPNKGVMDKVNAKLMADFHQIGCFGDADSPVSKDTADDDLTISVDYAKNAIFSVTEKGSYYCGGAYPTNDYQHSDTFDMTTGELVTLETMFGPQYFSENQPNSPTESGSANPVLTIIYKDLMQKAAAYIKAHPGVDITDDQSDAFCMLRYQPSGSDSTGALTQTQDFRLSSTSPVLFMRPEYPHVIESCIEEASAPIKDLLPYATPHSILRRI